MDSKEIFMEDDLMEESAVKENIFHMLVSIFMMKIEMALCFKKKDELVF